MKKMIVALFAFVLVAPIAGCGGEKEYKEPEGVTDVVIEGDDMPPLPGEGGDE